MSCLTEKKVRQNPPYSPFLFDGRYNELYKELSDAIDNFRLSIAPVVISQKDHDSDYQNIIESTQSGLTRSGLYVKQHVIYNGENYELSTVVHHGLSGQWYEKRDLISSDKNDHTQFECSVKFLKNRAYVDFLGLPVVDAESVLQPLDKGAVVPIGITYSDIRLFLDCDRCFYITKKYRLRKGDYDNDRFVLSNASDLVLKDEFDKCRSVGRAHPLMINEGVVAIPFCHKDLSSWQASNYGQGGIKFYDSSRNFVLGGVVDEILQNNCGDLIVLDFKTTSKDTVSMNDELGLLYRRQVSFYSFLLRKNNFPVYSSGYLIFDKPLSKCSYKEPWLEKPRDNEYYFSPWSESKDYKRQLAFKTTVLEVSIDCSWIEKTLDDIFACLSLQEPPRESKNIICFNCKAYYERKALEDRFEAIR